MVVVFAIVVVATTVAVVVARGGGLSGECSEHGKATTTKRALHAGACLNQGCKTGD